MYLLATSSHTYNIASIIVVTRHLKMKSWMVGGTNPLPPSFAVVDFTGSFVCHRPRNLVLASNFPELWGLRGSLLWHIFYLNCILHQLNLKSLSVPVGPPIQCVNENSMIWNIKKIRKFPHFNQLVMYIYWTFINIIFSRSTKQLLYNWHKKLNRKKHLFIVLNMVKVPTYLYLLYNIT